jgi:hypothetical protein
MKQIFLYSLPGNPSDTMRATLDSSGITYTELRLDKGCKRHNTDIYGVPLVIIVVGAAVHSEHIDAQGALDLWPGVSDSWVPPPPILSEEEELIAKRSLTVGDRGRILQLILRRLI